MPRHRISTLIAEYSHEKALHGGPQLTLRVIRQNYWMIGARNLVKTIIHKCIPCTRERASIPFQLMEDLPRARVSPSRPFLHTGVDYAGPFSVLPRRGRGQRYYKGYVAVFVCLSVRAIHLELVNDYSFESFLASFKRFTARCGIPSDLYSDNGTNFQGAAKELSSTFRNLMKDADLMSRLATDGTSWHFISPAAPHFGGIWEAGVKSMKHHLRRVIDSHTLSIEEFTTLLCQVEACLNSRPISPLANDPNDFAVLTPGHFLNGAPLVTVPDDSALDLLTRIASLPLPACASDATTLLECLIS
ncbi:uncharacterized protein LOC128888060 [Hylaeus anthracinus]|uniref:uncharacterized protein LOC128888060 n=1 Tax=Hylaeus anthracinus TaxID=313031 RepID=UPI0023B8C7C8|nr:uncharacterized protein LOC128888060 [Hylaeus anthracinus]